MGMSELPKAPTEIEVTINTIDGESWTSKQNEHETVRALIEKALAHFQIHPAPGTTYQLLLGGKALPPDQSLLGAGVKDGTVLLLGKEAQVGDGFAPPGE
jgi:hypothetical protein